MSKYYVLFTELIFMNLYEVAASKMQAIYLMCPQTLLFIQSHKQKSNTSDKGGETNTVHQIQTALSQ